MQRRKLIKSIIFLGLVASLCGATARVPAQQSAPTTSDQTLESALAKARAECKTLGSNPGFDRLRDKVPNFFGQQPTPLMFTNNERLLRKDRAVVDLLVGANQQCRKAYAPIHAMLPPQVIAAIHDLERKEDALISELYVGRITFGEFNMKIDGLNKEHSALVVRSGNVIAWKQTSQTNTNSETEEEDHVVTLQELQEKYSNPETNAFLGQISRQKTTQAQQGENPVELRKKANDLQAAARYAEAIPYALEVHKKANELDAAGRYAEAIPYARRALEIEERVSVPNYLNVAALLNSLALLYSNQALYADAEPRDPGIIGICRHAVWLVELNR